MCSGARPRVGHHSNVYNPSLMACIGGAVMPHLHMLNVSGAGEGDVG